MMGDGHPALLSLPWVEMVVLRLVLMLILSVGLDLPTPQAPEEIGLEELEDAAHHGRRRQRLPDASVSGPAALRETVTRAVRARPRRGLRPSRPSVTGTRVRKLPSLVSDSPASPEDH